MDLSTFFQKFEQFTDAPDAVAKLRELVLHSAVTGQLSVRLASDDSVDELLRALAAAKKRKSGSDRRRLSLREGAELVGPVVVPSHWAWASLSEIGEFSGGMTPSKAKSVFWDGDVNWFSSKDIKRDELVESELKITREGLEATGLKLYSPGCLVFVTRSGILKHTLPVSILRAEGTVNQDLKVLSLFIGGLERYIQIMLRGLNGFIIESLVKTGMTVQSLKFEEFAAQPFPLPPLAEQKRIVAKVDELMALCDRLEAQQQERETRHAALGRAALARFAAAPTPANLALLFHSSFSIPPSDLRKSILTLAVQGKLVPREKEPQMGSLESILSEASANGVSKGPTLDEAGTEILRISAGTSRGDFAVDEDDFKHVDLPLTEIEKFRLRPGDLLACRFNGNLHFVGRFSYYRGESGRVQVNPDKLIRFRIKTELNCPRYVCLAMNAAPTRSRIEGMCATTAGNIGLSAGRLKTVEIPLPPLAEQRRIVVKVEQLMALVDALEQQLAASRATAEKLLTALVAELTAA